MTASVQLSGFDAIKRGCAALTGQLRATSAKSGEVTPAAADMPKANALIRDGRNVFEVTPALERRCLEAFEARAAREVEAVFEGRSGSVAACLQAATEAARDEVRDRIDDVSGDVPKAPLKAPRRDGSTDHIGRDTGALHAGLVARLVG